MVNLVQTMEADGFQIGAGQKVNEAGTTFHYIAWKASANVKQATYASDGSDNRSITGVGFQPVMVWVKRSDTSESTWRSASTVGDLSHHWYAKGSDPDLIQTLEAGGFQVGANAKVNSSTPSTYHYIAFKDGGS